MNMKVSGEMMTWDCKSKRNTCVKDKDYKLNYMESSLESFS